MNIHIGCRWILFWHRWLIWKCFLSIEQPKETLVSLTAHSWPSPCQTVVAYWHVWAPKAFSRPATSKNKQHRACRLKDAYRCWRLWLCGNSGCLWKPSSLFPFKNGDSQIFPVAEPDLGASPLARRWCLWVMNWRYWLLGWHDVDGEPILRVVISWDF